MALVGKPVALMNKDDKVRAIRFLNESGAFLVTKSGDKVAKYFGINSLLSLYQSKFLAPGQLLDGSLPAQGFGLVWQCFLVDQFYRQAAAGIFCPPASLMCLQTPLHIVGGSISPAPRIAPPEKPPPGETSPLSST